MLHLQVFEWTENRASCSDIICLVMLAWIGLSRPKLSILETPWNDRRAFAGGGLQSIQGSQGWDGSPLWPCKLRWMGCSWEIGREEAVQWAGSWCVQVQMTLYCILCLWSCKAGYRLCCEHSICVGSNCADNTISRHADMGEPFCLSVYQPLYAAVGHQMPHSVVWLSHP